MKDISKTWKLRYLDLAKQLSSWSKDPSTKVGCVAIGNEGQVLSQGYNGFPRNVLDSEERYLDKETKYNYIVHAEMNCIYHASINGVSLLNSHLFVYGLIICHECAKGIIQVGIKKVYMKKYKQIPEKWEKSFLLTKQLFKEGGVDYEEI